MPSDQSAHHRVLRRIRSRGRGSVFVPADFLDLASRDAVDQTLSRLTRTGQIRRLTRGVYDYPKLHPRFGALSPPLTQVADAIARSTGARIQLDGAQAVNTLGLSTQVPAKLVYLTDGPSRTVQVGTRQIQFRHASPRKLAAAGTKAGTVIQALRYLGKDGVTPRVIQRLRDTVPASDRSHLRSHLKSVPDWLRGPLDDLATAA